MTGRSVADGGRSQVERVPVGTRVLTRWGRAVVTHDGWPDDPNYTIEYLPGAQHAGVSIAGLIGAFPGVYPDPSPDPAPPATDRSVAPGAGS